MTSSIYTFDLHPQEKTFGEVKLMVRQVLSPASIPARFGFEDPVFGMVVFSITKTHTSGIDLLKIHAWNGTSAQYRELDSISKRMGFELDFNSDLA